MVSLANKLFKTYANCVYWLLYYHVSLRMWLPLESQALQLLLAVCVHGRVSVCTCMCVYVHLCAPACVHLCVCTCVSMCTCVYVSVCTCVQLLVCMCAPVSAPECVSVYTCVSAPACVSVSPVCTCLCVCVHLHVCVYLCVSVCTCVHLRVCLCTCVCVHLCAFSHLHRTSAFSKPEASVQARVSVEAAGSRVEGSPTPRLPGNKGRKCPHRTCRCGSWPFSLGCIWSLSHVDHYFSFWVSECVKHKRAQPAGLCNQASIHHCLLFKSSECGVLGTEVRVVGCGEQVSRANRGRSCALHLYWGFAVSCGGVASPGLASPRAPGHLGSPALRRWTKHHVLILF